MAAKSLYNLPGGEAAQALNTILNLYMTGAQRLAELNLSAMREGVERTSSFARASQEARTPQDVQAVLLQPMLEGTQDYIKNAFEIVTDTQQEVLTVMMSQWGAVNRFGGATDWNSAMEAFTGNMRRYAGMAKENVAAATEAGARAASGASHGKQRSA